MSVPKRLPDRIKASLVAGTALVASGVLPAQAGALDPYLPKSGTISGHVVTFSISPEDQAISRRLRQAVQDNLEVFKQAAATNKPGTALPYDKRMGITEQDYDHLLHLKPDVTQLAAVTIDVVKTSDGGIGFKPRDTSSQPMAEVSFPTDESVARTPYGTLATFNEIRQSDASAPPGVWNGAEWAQVMSPDSGKPSAKIAFGKRAEDGRGVLYYQVAPYADHGPQSLVVFYTLD